MQEFNKFIIKEKTDVDKKIFKNHFGFQTLSALLKNLYYLNGETENNVSVSVIKRGLINFENEIEKMTEDEIKTEKPYEMVDIIKEILELNKRNKKGKDLKILAPSQMLSRLPISLAQLKGKNSENFKKEMRQILNSLYRSKKLTNKANL